MVFRLYFALWANTRGSGQRLSRLDFLAFSLIEGMLRFSVGIIPGMSKAQKRREQNDPLGG